MIVSGSVSASMPVATQAQSNSSINATQQKLIEETLAEFDANNLSESDALAIVEAFSEAGIQPGAELESLMSDAGFDAKTVGDLAGVGPKGQGPDSTRGGQFNEMVDLLSQLIDEALQESDDGQISDEQKLSIYEAMAEQFSVESNGSILHKVV